MDQHSGTRRADRFELLDANFRVARHAGVKPKFGIAGM
jgi:hypothetical protein